MDKSVNPKGENKKNIRFINFKWDIKYIGDGDGDGDGDDVIDAEFTETK